MARSIAIMDMHAASFEYFIVDEYQDCGVQQHDLMVAIADAIPRSCVLGDRLQLSKACRTTHQAAKEAVCRYRRGRTPIARESGLSPKSVRNVHRLLHRALSDAVAWDYLTFNPAEHASLPRERRRRQTPQPWTVDELSRWLA